MIDRILTLVLGLLIGGGLMFFMIPPTTGPAATDTGNEAAVATGEPAAPRTSAGTTLREVRERGYLKCGVTQGLPGFSSDNQGEWVGLDVDVCRSVAAAIFGDASKVRYTPLSAKERFTALQSGEIDLLSRITTWTLSRDTTLGVDFTVVNYYDGQGFMVHKDRKIASAAELDGATVCTNTGTTTELNLADYFRSKGMAYQIVAFEKTDEVIKAFEAGRCDATTTDVSGLYAERLKLTDPSQYIILPDVISKEPLAPVVRQGDDAWADLVRWVQYASLNAEQHGITSQNVESFSDTANPAIRRLLGLEGSYGADLGLSESWAVEVIRQVGNYGESYERNVGLSSPLGIPRGLNAQWTDGGLMYGMPVR